LSTRQRRTWSSIRRLRTDGNAIVAATGWVCVLLGVLAACGGGDRSTAWDHHGKEADLSAIESYAGAEHCGWQDVTFLNLRWPLSATGSAERRMYVRDPDNVLAEHALGDFSARATLPANAEFTGFSSDLGELWVVPDGQEPFAYLVSDDRVEAWPRTDQVLGCD
jgi:hypothetical protein